LSDRRAGHVCWTCGVSRTRCFFLLLRHRGLRRVEVKGEPRSAGVLGVRQRNDPRA